MEAVWSERNPRDGDDEEEEIGAAGEKPSKKKQPARKPESEGEGRYHPLSHGDAGEFFLSKRPGMIEKWLGEPKPEEEKDNDEDDEDEEEDKKEQQTAKKAAEETTEGTSTEANKPPFVKKAEPKVTKPSAPPIARPAQESLTGPNAEKPAWLEEDEAKFSKMMQEEFGQSPLKKAASDELLTDIEPGRPAAVENATNEREPVHTVESFRAEQEQRREGIVPGQAAEATPAGERQTAALGGEFEPLTAPRPPAERTPDAVPRYIEHRRGLRESMAAAMLMTVAVAGYIANRRRKREIHELQKEHRKDTRQQQSAAERMAAEHQVMQQQVTGQEERFAAQRAEQQRLISQATEHAAQEQPVAPLTAVERFKPVGPPAEAMRPLAAPTAAEAAKQGYKTDAEAAARRAVEDARAVEEASAQPQKEQIVTQDAWLRHVVDKSGHEVQGAIHHGHEYESERAQEIQAVRPADSISASPQAGEEYQEAAQPVVFTGAAMGAAPHQKPYSTPAHTVPDSGIADSDHSLPAGMPKPSDWQHRLSSGKKHTALVSALTSPWLFLMLSLILLAYFIASLL